MSPALMAIHSVIADHGASLLEPVPPKQAAATSMPTESEENARFFPRSGSKSSLSEVPSASFLRSMARDGVSEA